MRKRGLVWKLFPVYFAITLASVLVVGTAASVFLREFYQSQVEKDLVVRARLVGDAVRRDGILPKAWEPHALSPRGAAAKALKNLARSAEVRITLIAPSGKVIGDSEANPAGMANHADRPEFRAAMSGRIGISRRRSTTLGFTMVYAAIPIKVGGDVAAVVRVAQAATAVDSRPGATAYRILLAAVATAILAGALSWFAARRVAACLVPLRNAASQFACGNYTTRAPTSDIAEPAALAESFNSMADRIEAQLRELARQSAQQSAILASMKEGVLAVANDDRILITNPACERLLGVRAESAVGKAVHEVVRVPALHRFIELARKKEPASEEERILRTQEGRLLHLSAADLSDPSGREVGVLVVLSDVTQAAKLDQMRKDFVANVSHELKTPITAIKGYIETVLDMESLEEAKARRFLETAVRQADRLNAIVDDLLKLAEIEQRAESAQIELQTSPIRPVVDAAAAACRPTAVKRMITVEIECPEDLAAAINPPLLERAVTNLIDNAVKYSPEGAHVRVVAERTDGEVAIRVIDNGPGIEAEHIPRIFERFYRVDTARSRKLGGTGLGLAIVKHVAQAHGGRVEVQSTPGRGSTFTIYLPAQFAAT